MNFIEQIKEIDFLGWIITTFLIISIIIAGYKIFCEFTAMIGKPIGMMKQMKADHELLTKTAQGLTELRNTHEEDKVQSIRHDEMIREDLKSVVVMVNDISNKLVVMQEKDDAIEMAKLKEKILGYYRKYAPLGEWEKFEADVFWGLYENYINRGGNSFVRDDIEPVMRNLKIIN